MIPSNYPTIDSESTGYDYRPATKQKSEASKTHHARSYSYPAGREVLSPSKSASLVQDENHDHSKMNPDHIVIKVACRLFHSLFMYSYAYALHCTLTRGPTYLNGAQSRCGGACHAAHAALTPTLYDDILLVIAHQLGHGGFQSLDALHQKYLMKRFKLSEEDIQLLSSENQKVRSSHFEKIISRLTPRERQGTYLGTPTDHARNGTCDNNASSNRFDMHLEKTLRELDKTLSDKCKEGLTPPEALEQLQVTYKKMCENAINSLKSKKESFQALKAAHHQMRAAQPDDFENYLTRVETYLTAFGEFFKKLPGAPSVKNFKTELTPNPSQKVLKDIQVHKNSVYALNNSSRIVFLKDADAKFQAAEDEIDRRLFEAEHQLKVLEQTSDDIKKMYKNLFPIKNEDGILITPQKETLQKHFFDLIVPATPTRSDLKK